MLNDRVRNESYRQAIARVAPGKRVLDIGTGTGLLAMYAADAGALSVEACEADTNMAAIAGEVLEGSPSLRLHACDSKELTGPYDVAVMEVFDAGLLGEGVVPTLRHALHTLGGWFLDTFSLN